ncbi:MAG: hypothetical protein LRY27_03855 [Chitinophagales bacterium]|nr:hypothetical protein [Chitinophagales bacterium]
MKKFLFIILLFLIHTCGCPKDLSVIAIQITYHNAGTASWGYLIKTEKGNLSNKIDSSGIDLSSQLTNRTAEILIWSENYDYLIYLPQINHTDTITHFTAKKNKCDYVKDYSYYFNGVKKGKDETIEVYL